MENMTDPRAATVRSAAVTAVSAGRSNQLGSASLQFVVMNAAAKTKFVRSNRYKILVETHKPILRSTEQVQSPSACRQEGIFP